MAQGQYTDATAILKPLCQSNKRDDDAWLELGTAYAMQNKFNEAVRCYRYVHSINPRSAEPCFNLGKALAALGEKEEACNTH